jgi:pyroglutamyl-peptidase
MPSVLITAFEPYDCWEENSSWLTLIELTKNLPETPRVTTRRYPVDFGLVQEKLAQDLAADYNYALHLGQAPGSGRIQLEAVGLNIRGPLGQAPEEYESLVKDGPLAYRSLLPLGDWASKLRSAGIPSQVSYHAGTYLCNATLYLSHYLTEREGLKTQSALIHLPLDVSQTVDSAHDAPSLPKAAMASGIRLILEELVSVSDVV